jgi:hypothetical protein
VLISGDAGPDYKVLGVIELAGLGYALDHEFAGVAVLV